MNQTLRQRTVEQLKKGQLDMVIATDVAARGLDVERISHVLNYDIPYDDEAYVHRIGRTGRAGRKGKAILFVAPRERRMLRSIENTTRQKITQMQLPSRDELIDRRATAFKEQVVEGLDAENKEFFQRIVAELCHEQEASPEDIAAALAYLLQKDRPLIPPKDKPRRENDKRRDESSDRRPPPSGGYEKNKKGQSIPNLGNAQSLRDYPEIVMERFRIAVGHKDKVTPREIVGAIANEADIDGRYIGHIKIYDDFSTVDLPAGMPNELFSELKKTRVCQQPIKIVRVAEGEIPADKEARKSRPPANNRSERPSRDKKPRKATQGKTKKKPE